MVISSTSLQNQSSKVTLPFNFETSVFEAPTIQELQEKHQVSDEEYRNTLWQASKKYSKIQKRKKCCKITSCCSTTFFSIIFILAFSLALGLMIGIPKIGKNKINSTLTSKKAATLLVSGSTNKHQYIIEKSKSMKIKLKVFDYKPSITEMKNAFYDYYYVYIQNLNDFKQEETSALCQELRKSKHTTFIGGFLRNERDNRQIERSLRNCRKSVQHVLFVDPLPSSAFVYFSFSSAFVLFLLTATTICCCSCISKRTNKKLLKMERDLNRESMENYLPRGIQFSFNSDNQSNPQIDLYFYGTSNVNVNGKQFTAPLESSNYIQQPIPIQSSPVVFSQQQGTVYYQQNEEITPFLYPNPHGNINSNNNAQSYSTFPKQ